MRKIVRPDCPNKQALTSNYKHADNKLALQNASHGKCMYCESKVSHVYFGDVEHIQPKAEGKSPELKFDWENLGYCCARCNNAKGDLYDYDFPFIDPYSEDPEEHVVAFGTSLRHRTGSERGAITIASIDLNRPELIEKRAMRLADLQHAIDSCYRTKSSALQEMLLNALRTEGDVDREFSLFAAALLAANAP